MVEEINPLYYASNEITSNYELSGHGFLTIQEGSLGIFSRDNDNPLERLNSTTNEFLFSLDIVSDSQMTATCKEPNRHSDANYLGAIVSSDRQTIYWVNDTKPLP